MFGVRHVSWIVGFVAWSTLTTGILSAQGRKPKPQPPPPPPVVTCEIGCIPPYSVKVTPDNANGGQKPANTTGYSAVFTVTNNGANYNEYNLTGIGTFGITTITSVDPPYVQLDGVGGAVQWAQVTVYYNVGNAGSGVVRLQAEGVFGDAPTDAGWYNISVVGNPGAPIVALRNHNGDNRDRSLCLTSGAGEAAAWGCGDLVVTHGLPGYATMGRERSLTLLYNSAQAIPSPVVTAAVTNGGSVSQADSMRVELFVNGISRAAAKYASWGTIPATTKQVGMTYDASADATGIYPFQLLVRNKYASGSYDATVSDTLIVVNRSQSEFGAGWSLVGVEQLVLAQPGNKILWVGGDGSAKVYRNVATNVWQAAAGGYRDTLRYDPGTLTYTRTLRYGVQVKFDAQGRHIQTVNRVGQTSTFTWTGSPVRLTSIQVPPSVGATTYTLQYDGNNKLDRITDPMGRVLDASVVSNRLTSFIDADTYSTGFGYDAVGRMTSRTTRRGYATKFAYAKNLRVTQIKVPLNPGAGDTAVTAFTPWDERGFAFGSGTQTAIDTAIAYTKIDGARTSVADTALFWVDRWGAPVRTRDPVGNVTTVTRGSATLPSLITQVNNPDGSLTQMTWDNRGNLLTEKDSSGTAPHGVATAVTRWTYNSPYTKDSPDSIIDPEGIVGRFAYNSLGLLADATDANGHITHNEFIASGPLLGLLLRVIEQQVPNWDSTLAAEVIRDDSTTFSYNTLGNVISTTSPLGRITRTTRDVAQRVDTVIDPAGHRVDLTYDPLNRQLTSVQHEGGASLVTRQHWLVDVLDSIIDPRGVVRIYQYDAANRPTAEIDDFGKIERRFFGKSGLLDSLQARYWQDSASRKVRHFYDAAGLETKVTWPARRSSSAPNDSTVPADSIVFTHDAMYRALTAATAMRKVTRTYYAIGSLRSDIQSTQTGAAPNTHFYGYDRAGKRTWYRMGTPGSLAASDSVWYRYDAINGALKTIGVRWQGTGTFKDSVRFAWDALGRRDTVSYRNGTIVRFAYDADGQRRLVCSTHPNQGATPDVFKFTRYAISVSADGLVLEESPFVLGSATCGLGTGTGQSNTYNERHMVLTQNDGSGASSFAYDFSGNMTRKTTSISDDQYVIDPLHNRMRQRNDLLNSGRGTYYFYDGNGGRLDEVPFAPGADTSQTLHRRFYYYDGLGRITGNRERLCSVGPFGNCVAGQDYWVNAPSVCRYDGLGRLYNVCEAMASTIGFVGYDGDNVTRTGADGDINVWSFVHGPGVDDPIMGYAKDLYKGYAYYITDGDGRQLAVGDTLGWDFQSELSYYQNGGKLAGGTRNATTFNADRNQNPTMYKLSFFRNRFYDQETGRWTQEDPLGVAGGVNLYQYVGNNPVAFMDPFGLCAEGEGGGSDGGSADQDTSDVGDKAVRKCREAIAIFLASGALDIASAGLARGAKALGKTAANQIREGVSLYGRGHWRAGGEGALHAGQATRAQAARTATAGRVAWGAGHAISAGQFGGDPTFKNLLGFLPIIGNMVDLYDVYRACFRPGEP